MRLGVPPPRADSRRAKTAAQASWTTSTALALRAILIGNNLVNIAASSLGSVIVILLAGEQWTWVSDRRR